MKSGRVEDGLSFGKNQRVVSKRSRYWVLGNAVSRWSKPLLGNLRSGLATLRHLPDRLLHSRRRRATIDSIRRQGWPNNVLFVCLGNICRSPFAAAYFERRISECERAGDVRIQSAGFIGPERPSPTNAIAAAGESGIDLTGHRSRLVDDVCLNRVDLVLVMESRQRSAIERRFGLDRCVHLGDLDPAPITRRDILDPIEQDIDVFRDVYDRIERCVDGLLRGAIRPSESDRTR